MSHSFALLPLDDRPCNLEQNELLVSIAGIELSVPPKTLFPAATDKTTPYDYEGMKHWVTSQASKATAFALSTDCFLYGGLVRSRKMEITLEEVRTRIGDLKRIIEAHPQTRFYLFSVLLRLSITINSSQSEADWKNIFEYSVLSDQLKTNPGLKGKLAELKLKIPAPLLEEYLAVRQRNHEVNLGLLELGEKVAGLVYGQEDCAEFGLHRLEKLALSERAQNLKDKVLILNGADELGSLCLLKAYMDQHHVVPGSIPLWLKYSSESAKLLISRYEDVSVDENLKLHLKYSPFYEASSGQKVLIWTFPKSGQGDLCLNTKVPANLDSESLNLLHGFHEGDAILDLNFANGAHPKLMLELSSKFDRLSAFSAWNTTGNRLGTLIAQLGFQAVAKKAGELQAPKNKRYLAIRVLDDYLYQSVVRPLVMREVKDANLNPWDLGAAWETYSARVDLLMHQQAEKVGIDWTPPFKVRLPWARLFEASIQFL